MNVLTGSETVNGNNNISKKEKINSKKMKVIIKAINELLFFKLNVGSQTHAILPTSKITTSHTQINQTAPFGSEASSHTNTATNRCN